MDCGATVCVWSTILANLSNVKSINKTKILLSVVNKVKVTAQQFGKALKLIYRALIVVWDLVKI